MEKYLRFTKAQKAFKVVDRLCKVGSATDCCRDRADMALSLQQWFSCMQLCFLLPFNLFHFPAWNVFSKQSVALPTALIMYTSLKQSVALPINQCLSTHANPQSKEPSKYHQEFRGGQFSWVQKDKKEFDSDVGSKNAHCWDDAFQTARKCQILALTIWLS